jgi:ParB family transcriptional regulator, chromosome partitioning protein
MTKTDIIEIKLSDIDIPTDRARSFEQTEAEALAQIIAASGLQHPIRVRAVEGRFQLVAGRKRLEAFRLLGREVIPGTLSSAVSDDEARLEEVMENLGRFDLTKLDRCQHLFELKQVYERLHPETKHGGDHGNQHTGGKWPKWPLATDASEVFGFSSAVAERIGLSDRAIRRSVKIWTGLTPDSRTRLSGSRFCDFQSALQEISEQPAAIQAKALNLLLVDPPVVSTVADALAMISDGVAPTAAEKKIASVSKAVQSLAPPVASALSGGDARRLAELQEGIATLSKFIARLEDDELDSVIVEHEDRIIASLKRRGRI